VPYLWIKISSQGACDKVTEKGKWSAKPANATTVVYNSARPGQFRAHSLSEEMAAPAPVSINRVELDTRPVGESVYDDSTGRQSADANRLTTTTAPTATNANSPCDEIPTISYSPTCSDSNAVFLMLVLKVLYHCLMSVKLL